MATLKNNSIGQILTVGIIFLLCVEALGPTLEDYQNKSMRCNDKFESLCPHDGACCNNYYQKCSNSAHMCQNRTGFYHGQNQKEVCAEKLKETRPDIFIVMGCMYLFPNDFALPVLPVPSTPGPDIEDVTQKARDRDYHNDVLLHDISEKTTTDINLSIIQLFLTFVCAVAGVTNVYYNFSEWYKNRNVASRVRTTSESEPGL